jgi:hypothetical protein
MAATSPRITPKTRPADQPRQRRVPISARRARTAANAPLATKQAQVSSTRKNRATLLRSSASRITIAAPFRTQSSLTRRGGCPWRPAGRSTSSWWGEDPAVTSTASPVLATIAAATRRIRSRLTLSGPVTPATRMRITLTGAAWSAAR